MPDLPVLPQNTLTLVIGDAMDRDEAFNLSNSIDSTLDVTLGNVTRTLKVETWTAAVPHQDDLAKVYVRLSI